MNDLYDQLPRMITATPTLRHYRESASASMSDIAKKAGLSNSALSHIELGRKTRKTSLFAVLRALQTVSPNLHDFAPFIAEMQDRRTDAVTDLNQLIPEQNSVIRFGVSEGGKLTLIPGLGEQNDYQTISAMRAEILAALDILSGRYSKSLNTPQAAFFSPIVESYQEELQKDLRDINYAILFARGTKLVAAKQRAVFEVEAGEWPLPEAQEGAAIDTVCDLHGPLMMASEIGRRIVRNREEYETTAEDQIREEVLIGTFGEVLGEASDIFEPETAKAIQDLTAPIPSDPQPGRSRGLRTLVVGSALVSTVGMVAWANAGWGGLIPVAVAGMVGWEAVKKTSDFKAATDAIATGFDKGINLLDVEAQRRTKDLIARLRIFLSDNRSLMQKVASLRPEFSWAKLVLSKGGAPLADESQKKNPHLANPDLRPLIVVGDVEEARNLANNLCRELNIPLVDVGSQMEYLADRKLSEYLLDHGPAAASELVENILRTSAVSQALFLIDRSQHAVLLDLDLSNIGIYHAYVAHVVAEGDMKKPDQFVSDIRLSFMPGVEVPLAERLASNYRDHGDFDRAADSED